MSTAPGERLGWDRMRISDADREKAAAALGEHYAQGRLTADEHEERLDRVLNARTPQDITPLFLDLPGPMPLAPPAPAGPVWGPPPGWAPRGRGRSRLGRLPVPILVLLIVVGAFLVMANLPLIVIGLAIWFFFLRGACGTRMHRRW